MILKRIFSLALMGGVLLMTACSNNGSSTGSADTSAQKTTTTAAQTVTSKEIGHKTAEEYGKVVALTFDDGPNTTTTGEVLDLFEQYGARGTFFLIGDNINEQSAQNVRRAYEMGNEIANHSKTHSYMNEMTPDEIKAEIDYTSDRIYDITGQKPKFFRPPYIAVNQTMFDTIDLTFINGFGCTDYENSVTADQRYERTMKQVRDGAIILLHDQEGNFQTVQALERLIPDLQAQGYELVTLSELFFAKGVELDKDKDIIYSYADQTTMYG